MRVHGDGSDEGVVDSISRLEWTLIKKSFARSFEAGGCRPLFPEDGGLATRVQSQPTRVGDREKANGLYEDWRLMWANSVVDGVGEMGTIWADACRCRGLWEADARVFEREQRYEIIGGQKTGVSGGRDRLAGEGVGGGCKRQRRRTLRSDWLQVGKG